MSKQNYKKILSEGVEGLKAALEKSKRHETEVSALLEASRAILKYKKFQESARAIFDACKDLIEAKAGYVALLSSDGSENEVLFLESGRLPCTVDPSLPMPIRGLRAEAYHEKKATYENNFPESNWIQYLPKGHVRLENVLFAPLIIEDKAVGLIGLSNKDGGFNEQDKAMATAFGEFAAIALINSRLLDSLERQNEDLLNFNEKMMDREIRISEIKEEVNLLCEELGREIKYPSTRSEL